MQNDVVRFAKNVRLKDMISRTELHKEAKMLSLSQRREKQLLILMYKTVILWYYLGEVATSITELT